MKEKKALTSNHLLSWHATQSWPGCVDILPDPGGPLAVFMATSPSFPVAAKRVRMRVRVCACGGEGEEVLCGCFDECVGVVSKVF